MKNFFLSLLLLFFVNTISAQEIEISPNIKVTYNSVLNLGENYKQKQIFVLLGNSQDYYFAGYQNYLKDSKEYIPSGIDVQSISDYFKEKVIKKDGKLNVLFSFSNNNIKYEEAVPLKWVLYEDIKIIAGVKCQMAATNLFGRRWIAYFSKEHNQNIGPYKFNGLPGLIMELYDTKKDYYFVASKVEKYTKNFVCNTHNFKNFSKENYLKAKFNIDFGGAGLPVMQGEMKRDFDQMMERRKKKYNNPIELEP